MTENGGCEGRRCQGARSAKSAAGLETEAEARDGYHEYATKMGRSLVPAHLQGRGGQK